MVLVLINARVPVLATIIDRWHLSSIVGRQVRGVQVLVQRLHVASVEEHLEK